MVASLSVTHSRALGSRLDFEGESELDTTTGYVAEMALPRSPKGRAKLVHQRLKLEYPEAICELDHQNPFELLVATILSAQCTDVRVNMVTPELFRRWPDAERLSEADPEQLAEVIRSTGF